MLIKYPESVTPFLFTDEFSLWAAVNGYLKVSKDGGAGFFSSPVPYSKDTHKKEDLGLELILINQAVIYR
jgi:hypothetical protein